MDAHPGADHREHHEPPTALGAGAHFSGTYRMKHVAIVGSRQRTDRETVDRLVARLPDGAVIVSGGAPGPDTWAEEAALRYGRKIQVIRPDLEGARSQGQVTRRYHASNQRIVDHRG